MCAVAQGVRAIDASLGGAGPQASSADGSPARGGRNLATTRIAATLGDAGYETGLDLEMLADAEAFLEQTLESSRQTA
jgi:isopropylmalate/homocitrate/citramalate synthase